jgi:hypothetical protein
MRAILLSIVLATATFTVSAAEPSKALEDAFNAAMASKRGVTLYVNGQTIAGAVTKIEPGRSVELRSQEFSRIVVRWESIDGIAMP